jgi:hypothetical protein
LQTIDISKKIAGKLQAKMDSAEVSLPVKTQNYRTVVFYCRFKSGNLWIADDNGYKNSALPVDQRWLDAN